MPTDSTDPSVLVEKIDGGRFAEWYRERTFARNIRDGKPYFNGPSPVPDPERHSPSQLLQCHRKIAYRQANAPEETADPEGMFWTGRRFEEDIVVPYLQQAVVGEGTYVRNSMWVDETVETDGQELRIKGTTDPVLVTAESEPLVVTEVKTKESLAGVSEPNRHHRAQVHAYMYGLSEQYDRSVGRAVLIYGDRTTLDVEPFDEPFDEAFWDTVVSWAGTHSQFRRDGVLPPADPEYGWECGVCSFRHRCGQSDEPYADTDVAGFLPQFDAYPRPKVVEYLEAHEDAKLTPTLAAEYPDLAAASEVRDWRCPQCGTTVAWDEHPRNDVMGNLPLCPDCADRGVMTELRVTPPSGNSR